MTRISNYLYFNYYYTVYEAFDLKSSSSMLLVRSCDDLRMRCC